jgi:hypothetical protein
MKTMTNKIPRDGVAASHLTIFVGKERRKVLLPVKKDGMTIGRNSKKAKVDFDTNPFDGLEMGVSREHLLIMPKRDFFIVKDLETANSTWHNKVRMRPLVAEELYHGDILHMGELRLEIYYTYPDELRSEQQTNVLGALGDTKEFPSENSLPDTKQLGNPTQQSGATRRFDDD